MTYPAEIGKDLDKAVRLLKAGLLVAVPTETVYGLAADASNPEAIARLYKTKGRPSNHPVIVHACSKEHLIPWVRFIDPLAEKLAERFWPGPLTMIMERSATKPALLLDMITGSQNTIAVRVPRHDLTLELLRKLGGAVVAPSANKFGKLSPTAPEDVALEFADIPDVAYVIDGGRCQVGIESTIIDTGGGILKILRPGMISATAMEKALDLSQSNSSQQEFKNNKTRVPGAMKSHYAPGTPLLLAKGTDLEKGVLALLNQGKSVAVLSFSEPSADIAADYFAAESLIWKISPCNAAEYARNLYENLRSLDKCEKDFILVESVLEKGEEWLGINDRLSRAASGEI